MKLVLTSLIFPQAHLTAAGKENGVLKTLNPESQNPKNYFSKNEETKDFPSKVKILQFCTVLLDTEGIQILDTQTSRHQIFVYGSSIQGCYTYNKYTCYMNEWMNESFIILS